MCGIAGIYDQDGGAAEMCLRLLEPTAYRGPDSVGVHDGGIAAVGQNRLAVIDLVTGDPPITTPDGRIGVALNGEIYGFAELRAGLLARGHAMRTQGDAEVIAHLAEELEPCALAAALDGMFAVAVWDARAGRLVLMRDRVGKKPLHWWSDGRRLVFGSEIKSVLAHPAVPRRLDERAIAAHLTFGYVPTPGTFYEGIQSLPPGCVLTFDGERIDITPYWTPPIVGRGGTERLRVSMGDAAALVRDELTRAVERRLVADVPLGAFLSGGVDSSAIVALMVRLGGRSTVRTFTVGFDDDQGYDEREAARRTARALGTEHHEFAVKPDVIDLAERLVFHHDQPFGDSSAIPLYLLSAATREHVTVALSGDGGDEAFAGYERFSAASMLRAWSTVPAPTRRAVARLAGRRRTSSPKHPLRKLQRFVEPGAGDVLDAYLSWLSFADRSTRAALLHRSPDSDWAEAHHRAIWESSEGAALGDRLLDLNLRTYLLDDLLPKADRMSMAHGLEVRSPFLDHRLLELALRLPPSLRARAMSRKRVLRAAVRDIVPAHVLSGPKKGFAVPLDRWFRTDLRSWIEDLLGPGASARRHLDGHGIDSILAEHASGAAHHGQLLWALITLELFLRREGW